MTVVRAVAFDAVGTLIAPDPPAPVVYEQVGRRHGSRLSADAIAVRFRPAFQREEAYDQEQGWRTSEGREVSRWRRIVAAVLDDVDDAASCFQELYEHFAQPQAWRCDRDAAWTLNTLAARGYRLAVASNFDRRLRDVAAGLPALGAVQTFVISSEVGWRKPAGAYFAALVHALDVPPANLVLVGDDLDNDYEGARAAGVGAILLDPDGHYNPLSLPRVGRLVELVGLL